jgi:hypothetical protein
MTDFKTHVLKMARSTNSYPSFYSLRSFLSLLSLLSAGSILSIGSVGSILSIGSRGGILTIGKTGMYSGKKHMKFGQVDVGSKVVLASLAIHSEKHRLKSRTFLGPANKTGTRWL